MSLIYESASEPLLISVGGEFQRRVDPVDPSFRALSGRLNFTVRRHKFNKDSLSAQFQRCAARRRRRRRSLLHPRPPPPLPHSVCPSSPSDSSSSQHRRTLTLIVENPSSVLPFACIFLLHAFVCLHCGLRPLNQKSSRLHGINYRVNLVT